jgi:hypothetical protein
MGRARVPARREDVPGANGAFPSLIREGGWLRERRIARTRSLPALGPAAAGAITAFPCVHVPGEVEQDQASC